MNSPASPLQGRRVFRLAARGSNPESRVTKISGAVVVCLSSDRNSTEMTAFLLASDHLGGRGAYPQSYGNEYKSYAIRS